jgi:hypothetical protein
MCFVKTILKSRPQDYSPKTSCHLQHSAIVNEFYVCSLDVRMFVQDKTLKNVRASPISK